jgi:hypothetical protein
VAWHITRGDSHCVFEVMNFGFGAEPMRFLIEWSHSPICALALTAVSVIGILALTG